MKTEKNCLIIAVLTGILSIAAYGGVELPLSNDKPFLIGQAYPELVGIKALNVAIVPTYTDPNEFSLLFEELQQKIVNKLQEADIRAAPMLKGKFSIFSFDAPDFRVYINILEVLDSQKYVICIQTALARTVALPGQHKSFFKADVWKTNQVMQVVSFKDMPATVTNVVLKQVGAFAAAWREANPPNKKISDANNIGVASLTASKEQAGSATKPSVAEYSYVASKKSKVFHKSGCRWVKNISPGNLVRYASREEAIKDGKKPCSTCKP